ncbi:Gfo/Idh/MocA family oxidoreductase [Paenibacillus sp. IITD108]
MNIGVIGLGSRAQGVLSFIQKADSTCKIAAIADPGKMQEQAQNPSINYYENADDMLQNESLDGVLIGTRCNLHTELAMKVLPTGIPLYLEKPVSTTMEDLRKLKAAYEKHPSPSLVSFPLRFTTIVQLAKEIIDSGKIGTVEHVQAINNVPYGGVYFHNWYRDESITGGLFLQKATHDFDYINAVLGMQPVEICAMTSKQIFKGDKPAGLTCKTCDENRTCEESTAFDPDLADVWTHCAFGEDTGNEDSGSALIRYESGMHASYSQNFFARRGAGTRGARFLGYKGTLEFDFTTGKLQVFMHHTPRVDTYQYEMSEGHFGGDDELARNFIEMMQGKAESKASLQEGLTSALMCLKAKESAETRQFCKIEW